MLPDGATSFLICSFSPTATRLRVMPPFLLSTDLAYNAPP